MPSEGLREIAARGTRLRECIYVAALKLRAGNSNVNDDGCVCAAVSSDAAATTTVPYRPAECPAEIIVPAIMMKNF